MSLVILKPIVVLGSIFLVFPVLLFFGLRRLARPMIRRMQTTSRLRLILTPAGYIVFGMQVLYMLACVVAHTIYSAGGLGEFLRTYVGFFCAIAVGIVGFNVLAAGLTRAGYPLLRRGARRDL
jgi:hypothetical protein